MSSKTINFLLYVCDFRIKWKHAAIHLNKTVETYFLIGKSEKLTQLKGTNQTAVLKSLNVIQTNIVDHYLNLTLKTMAMVKWVSLYCNSPKFIAKIDDDTLVNIPKLLNKLATAKNQNLTKTIIGRVAIPHLIPRRNSIWNINNDSFPLDAWPTYVNGFLYVFTNDITQQVLKRILDVTTPVVNIEDIYLTGIVRSLENIALIDIRVEGDCSGKSLQDARNYGVHHYDLLHARCRPKRKQIINETPIAIANKDAVISNASRIKINMMKLFIKRYKQSKKMRKNGHNNKDKRQF